MTEAHAADGPETTPEQLLLPSGRATRLLTLGGGLGHGSRATDDDRSPVDLVALAPTADERRDSSWVEAAVGTARGRLAADGVVLLASPRALGIRWKLAAAGLAETGYLLMHPGPARVRTVALLDSPAGRFALGELASESGKRALLARGLRIPGVRALGPTGVLFRRPGAAPLARWLDELRPPPRPDTSVLLTRSWKPGGSIVVRRFLAGGSVPELVAKVSPAVGREQAALREVAPTAERAGARVPQPLGLAEVGARSVLLETPVAGRSAAVELRRRRVDCRALQARVTALLASWGGASSQRAPLSRDELERELLVPARRLCPPDDYSAYDRFLRELCAEAAGASVPFVPAHNDLTAANLVLDDSTRLGVIDWEEATPRSLPLVDFFYAVADVAAAVDGYAGRPAALAACFAPPGTYAPHVREQLARLVRALGVAPPVAEVAFHVCWTHHAVNEMTRDQPGSQRPFREILDLVARDPLAYRGVIRPR